MKQVVFLLTLVVMVACRRQEKDGDPQRGRMLIEQYGCQACHVIPGMPGPRGAVGPPLDHVATRSVIGGGKLPNTPENMARWLQNPQAFDPMNTMPNLNVTPADAKDLSAFLFTLK